VEKHRDIELSFFDFIYTKLELVYNYTINYGNAIFESEEDLWINVVFEEINAGTKRSSPVRLDVVTRIHDSGAYENNELDVLDNIRSVLTNADISYYNYDNRLSPILFTNNKLIVVNSDGRFTVERIHRGIDLKLPMVGSSVYCNVKLLSDFAQGMTI